MDGGSRHVRCITGCCALVAITLLVKKTTASDLFDTPFAFVAFRMSLLAVIASWAELSIATKEFDIRDFPAQILQMAPKQGKRVQVQDWVSAVDERAVKCTCAR